MHIVMAETVILFWAETVIIALLLLLLLFFFSSPHIWRIRLVHFVDVHNLRNSLSLLEMERRHRGSSKYRGDGEIGAHLIIVDSTYRDPRIWTPGKIIMARQLIKIVEIDDNRRPP